MIIFVAVEGKMSVVASTCTLCFCVHVCFFFFFFVFV